MRCLRSRAACGDFSTDGLPGKAVQNATRGSSFEKAHRRPKDGVCHSFVELARGLQVKMHVSKRSKHIVPSLHFALPR